MIQTGPGFWTVARRSLGPVGHAHRALLPVRPKLPGLGRKVFRSDGNHPGQLAVKSTAPTAFVGLAVLTLFIACGSERRPPSPVDGSTAGDGGAAGAGGDGGAGGRGGTGGAGGGTGAPIGGSGGTAGSAGVDAATLARDAPPDQPGREIARPDVSGPAAACGQAPNNLAACLACCERTFPGAFPELNRRSPCRFCEPWCQNQWPCQGTLSANPPSATCFKCVERHLHINMCYVEQTACKDIVACILGCPKE